MGNGAGGAHVAPFPRPDELGVSADEAADHAPPSLTSSTGTSSRPRRRRAT